MSATAGFDNGKSGGVCSAAFLCAGMLAPTHRLGPTLLNQYQAGTLAEEQVALDSGNFWVLCVKLGGKVGDGVGVGDQHQGPSFFRVVTMMPAPSISPGFFIEPWRTTTAWSAPIAAI